MRKKYDSENKIVYCKCPGCGILREKLNRKFTIIRKGLERNGLARFKCLKCGKWFNEKTCDSMLWFAR